MTDNEIIKALEEYIKENEFEYFHSNTMGQYRLIRGALTLINRLQAENEKLKYQVNRLKNYDEKRDISLHSRLIANARAEAIKGFAERLKENADTETYFDSYNGERFEYKISTVDVEDIDDLVKEMVGEE